MRQEGPTAAEIARGRAQAHAAFTLRLQSLGGFGGRADQLNAYNVYRNAPDSFEMDLSRYLSATEASVQAAAARWLDPHHAVSLAVVPVGRRDLAHAGAEPVGPIG
jgi:zinc protease